MDIFFKIWIWKRCAMRFGPGSDFYLNPHWIRNKFNVGRTGISHLKQNQPNHHFLVIEPSFIYAGYVHGIDLLKTLHWWIISETKSKMFMFDE